MDKLKPCPFCGKQGYLHSNFSHFNGYGVSKPYSPRCGNCEQTQYDWYETEQEAIEAWNTRKGENQIENNIQAVAEVLGLNKGEENG